LENFPHEGGEVVDCERWAKTKRSPKKKKGKPGTPENKKDMLKHAVGNSQTAFFLVR